MNESTDRGRIGGYRWHTQPVLEVDTAAEALRALLAESAGKQDDRRAE